MRLFYLVLRLTITAKIWRQSFQLLQFSCYILDNHTIWILILRQLNLCFVLNVFKQFFPVKIGKKEARLDIFYNLKIRRFSFFAGGTLYINRILLNMMIGPSGMDTNKYVSFFSSSLFGSNSESDYQVDHRHKFNIKIWIKENEESNISSHKC